MLSDRARTVLDKIIEDAETPGEHPSRRVFTLPRLTPYMWDAHLAKSLCRACWQGSGVLIKLTLRGLRRTINAGWNTATQGKTAADQAESLAVAALAGAIGLVVIVTAGGAVAYFVAPYAQQIGMTAGAAWLVTAAALAPREVWNAPAKTVRGEPKQTSEQHPAAPLDAATVARLVRQIAAAEEWKGVHLDDLLAHLPRRSRTELLDVLAEARIPVENQLKLTLPGGRQRNRQGVRVSALPPGLGEAPATPAEAPPPGSPEGPAEAPTQPLPDRATAHPQ